MKFVFLHGLGQTAQDWQVVIHQSSLFDVDCPELFSFAENAFTYSGILSGLERFYANASEPFVLCGLSKHDTIKLSHSMRMLDFSPKLSEIHCPGVRHLWKKGSCKPQSRETAARTPAAIPSAYHPRRRTRSQ